MFNMTLKFDSGLKTRLLVNGYPKVQNLDAFCIGRFKYLTFKYFGPQINKTRDTYNPKRTIRNNGD